MPEINCEKESFTLSRKVQYVWLGLTMFAAVVVRFAWLSQQGFVEFDEGWLVESATSMAGHLRGERRDMYLDFKACPITTLISAIPIAIFGSTPAAIMFPSAVMGFLGTLAVALLAYRLYGTFTALIAFTFVAVSPMQTLFSRSVALDTFGFFFLCGCYLLIIHSTPREKLSKRSVIGLFASGLALGLALASNYRALACILLPSGLILIREGIRAGLLPRLLAIHLSGFAGSLALIDIAMRFFYPVSKGYFHIFSEQYRHIGSKTFGSASALLPSLRIQESLSVLSDLWAIDNELVICMAFVWFIILPALLWKGSFRRSDLQLALILGAPFILFSALSVTAVRGVTVAQPLLAVAAARLCSLVINTTHVHRGFVGIALAAMLTVVPTVRGLYRTSKPDVMGRENPFEVAFRETCSKYQTGVITILDSGPEYYAARQRCPSAIVHMGAGPLDLLETYLRGFRFWLIDAQLSAYKPRLFAIWPVFEKRSPDLFVPAPSYVRLDHFIEHKLWSGTSSTSETVAYQDWIHRWGSRLPVFDLDNHIRPLTWQQGMRDWYQVGDAYVSLPSKQALRGGYRVAWNTELRGSGAAARFNMHFNILPVQVGVGLCDAASSDTYCHGIGVVATISAPEARFALIELSDTDVRTIKDQSLAQPPVGLHTALSITCTNGRLSVKFGDKSVFDEKLARPCGESYPALITGEGKHLEALELNATDSQ